MKKFIIAIAVLFMYALYSLGIRHQSPTISKPSSLANSSSSSAPSTNTSGTTSSPSSTAIAQYKDGTYTGSVADAYYGNVQVAVVISGGKITAVNFLQYPNTHSTSMMINQQVMPYLQQEAIQAQSSNVQIISGATFTSQAFAQSLDSVLTQVKV